MILKKLEIQNFKRIENQTIDFVPGINVIKGDNEKGKSTLVDAIQTVLFTSPTTRATTFFNHYSAWHSSKGIYLTIEFENGGILYTLEKDFSNKTVKLTNLAEDKSWDSEETISDFVNKLLGVPSGDYFRATALVQQYEMTAIQSGGDLMNSVQRTITGEGLEGKSVSDVVKKLEAEINDYNRGLERPAKNNGIIKELRDKLQTSEARLRELKQKYEKVRGAGGQKTESESKLEEINSKISLLEQQLDNQKIFDEATKKVEDLNAQIKDVEEEIQQIDNLRKDLGEVEEKVEKLGGLANLNLNEVSEKISSAVNMVKTLETELNEIKNKSQKVSLSVSEQIRRNRKILIFALIAFVITIIIGGLSLFIGKFYIVFFPLLITVVLFLLYTSGRSSAKGQGSRELINQQQKEKESKISEQKSVIDNEIMKVGCESVDDFFTKKAEIGGLLESRDRFEAILKDRLKNKSYEELKKRQVDLLTQKKEIEVNELTEDVKRSKLDPDKYLQKRRELDNLRFERSRLEEKRTQSSVRIKDAEVSLDDINLEEEKLKSLQEKFKEATHKKQVLEMTYQGIKTAAGQLSSNVGSSLYSEVEKYLPMITGDRYSKIKIGEDFAVSVFSDEKKDWIDLIKDTKVLSQATIEQIYFAIRIAFLRIMSKTARPPFILDDPFVVFDRSRREQTFKVLQEIAKENQVILLTCHSDYDNWGNLIQL